MDNTCGVDKGWATGSHLGGHDANVLKSPEKVCVCVFECVEFMTLRYTPTCLQFCTVDSRILLFGSFNYSKRAHARSGEIFVVESGRDFLAACAKIFAKKYWRVAVSRALEATL